MKQRLSRLGCVIITLVALCSTGCTALEDGFKQGLSDGFSSALAAAISAPIDFILDQTFRAGG